MGDAPKLREELSVWFAGLGDTLLAAGTLVPLLEREREPAPRAQLLIRIAVLRSRAGDSRGAAQALIHAADADRSDPLPYELLGALGAWASDTLSPAKASRAFLEAAQRRLEKNDSRGSAENLLQAFEVAPGYELAAERLAQHLAQAGRFQAADEVMRTCARFSSHPAEIHSRRLRDALGGGGLPVALGAALDARADVTLEAETLVSAATLVNDGAGLVPIPNFDGLLFPLGAGELLAARLELLSMRQTGAPRARSLFALARLCAGPIGNPARSARHLSDALVADPDNADALGAMRQYAASSGDYGPWQIAAERLAAGRVTPGGALVVSQLVHAGENLEPSVVLWLIERLQEEAHGSPELDALEVSVCERAERADSEDTSGGANWGSVDLEALYRQVAQTSGNPAALERHLAALEELRRRDSESPRWVLATAQALERGERFGELETLWRDQLEAAEDPTPARLALLRLQLKRGQEHRALELLTVPSAAIVGEEAALLSALASVHGDVSQRALGLSILAGTVRPNVRATLYSVAAESAHQAGDPERALRLAELACRADPAAARPVVCYAQVAGERRDRVAALALERACEVTVPRADWCRQLAEAAEAQGHPETALRWLRRWVSLTPLNQAACAALLQALARQDNVEPLNKGLTWLLGQPQPISRLAADVTLALRRLAELDARGAERHAGRLLGVLGVGDPELTAAILEIADKTGEPRLRLAVYERQLPGLRKADAGALLLQISEQRISMGDADGAADALRRALRSEADPQRVLALLAGIGVTTTSDGELALLECRALGLLGRAQAADPGQALIAEAAEAFRQWGAALWDLAGDRGSAITAWQTGAELDAEHGDEGLARDLIAFSGCSSAVPMLLSLARGRERKRGAALLVVAGAAALFDGFKSEALTLAEHALELDPSRTEALAVLERAAGAEDLERLAQGYAKASSAVLGAYGERALNYRAARQFERRGVTDRALKHALIAFESVPAEGVTFALMLRLSQVHGDNQAAARSIERVAARVADSNERVHWLDRAARAVGPGLEGKRLRVDVLLRTLGVQVEVETLQVMKGALQELLEADAASRAVLGPRIDSIARSLIAGLDRGSDVGSALCFAEIAKDIFEDAGLCATAVTRALELDPIAPQFMHCGQFAAFLGERPASVAKLIDATERYCQESKPVHSELLALVHGLAHRWAKDRAPLFAVARAEQSPADLQLLAVAKAEAQADAVLLARIESITPWSEHLLRVFTRVDELVPTDPERALELLRGVLAEPRLEGEEYSRAVARLREIYAGLGQTSLLEELMLKTLESPRLSYDQRTEVARELATLLVERDAYTAALDVLLMAERWDGLTASDYERAADLAARGGDVSRELSLLIKLEMLSPEALKPALWRRTAELHQRMGSAGQAVDCYERVLEVEPGDPEARQFILNDAEQRQDWRQLADLLTRDLASEAPRPEKYLRLAEVFGERMRNPGEAIAVLQRGAEFFPEEPRLLGALANALRGVERLPEAAEAFRRASRATRDPSSAAHFAELACRSYLDAGDSGAAQRLLSLKGVYPNTEQLAALRVELARVRCEHRELGAALDELAAVSMGDPIERAGILREAAELALTAGDLDLALARAQRAFRVAPGDAAVQLFCNALEYRRRGPGSPDVALATISELRSMSSIQEPELIELRAFLLAEALDRRVGSGAGISELQDAERRVGARPLIALGLAERFSSTGRSDEALDYYDRAFCGDLQGFRDPAEVALFAARYAQQVGDLERALHFAVEGDNRATGARGEIAELLLELKTQRVARRKIEPAYTTLSKSPRSAQSTGATLSPLGSSERPTPSLQTISLGGDRVTSRPDTERTVSHELTTDAELKGETEPEQTEPVPLVHPNRSRREAPGGRHGEWKATQPVFVGDLPSERPPEVTVMQDPRTLAKTWASGEAQGQLESDFQRAAGVLSPGEHLAVAERPRADGETPPSAAEGQLWEHSQPIVHSLGRKSVRATSLKHWETEVCEPPETPAVQRVQSLQHLPTNPGLGALRVQELPPGGVLERDSKPTPMDGVAAQSQRRFRSTRRSSPPPPREAEPLRSPLAPGSTAESGLWRRLRAGETEAGLSLAAALEADATRVHELVGVYRLCAAQQPGNLVVLQKLYEASVSDSDLVYATCLRHTCMSFRSPGEAPAAPGLTYQQEDNTALLRLLSPQPVPALEALALIWQEATHLFRPRSSQLPDYKRVAAAETNPFSQLVAAAAHLLGATRTAVRHRAGGAAVSFRVRLQSPVELLVDGDAQPESPEFRYHFGAMLLATRPEYALMYGLSEIELTTVLDAVLAAFGPPRRLEGDVAQIAQFAESLWESLSPRAQRRMQELCEAPEQMSYSVALVGTNRALRRAGLFVSGDIGVAVRQVCEEDREDVSVLTRPDGLSILCARNEHVADLVRFATSLEYAEARWRPPRAQSNTLRQLLEV
jgi:tetratricopeptide (TPR) repeat protein